MTRRQLLFGSGVTWVAGLGAISPWSIARATVPDRLRQVRQGDAPQLRLGGMRATELGAVVRGSYQLRAASVAHRTLI